MPTYAQNKIHIYKYRVTHPDKIKEIRILSNHRGIFGEK